VCTQEGSEIRVSCLSVEARRRGCFESGLSLEITVADRAVVGLGGVQDPAVAMGICASTEKDPRDAVDKQALDDSNKAGGEKQITVQPKKTDPAAGAAAAAAPAPAPAAATPAPAAVQMSSPAAATPAPAANNSLAPPSSVAPTPSVSKAADDKQPRTSTTAAGTNADAEHVEIKLVDTPTSATEIANYLKNVPVLGNSPFPSLPLLPPCPSPICWQVVCKHSLLFVCTSLHSQTESRRPSGFGRSAQTQALQTGHSDRA
jgi:hypothetical protein